MVSEGLRVLAARGAHAGSTPCRRHARGSGTGHGPTCLCELALRRRVLPLNGREPVRERHGLVLGGKVLLWSASATAETSDERDRHNHDGQQRNRACHEPHAPARSGDEHASMLLF